MKLKSVKTKKIKVNDKWFLSFFVERKIFLLDLSSYGTLDWPKIYKEKVDNPKESIYYVFVRNETRGYIGLEKIEYSSDNNSWEIDKDMYLFLQTERELIDYLGSRWNKYSNIYLVKRLSEYLFPY